MKQTAALFVTVCVCALLALGCADNKPNNNNTKKNGENGENGENGQYGITVVVSFLQSVSYTHLTLPTSG